MDERVLDVIIGVAGFLILSALFALLPMVIPAAFAYLTAIVGFVLFLSIAGGYWVNAKIT